MYVYAYMYIYISYVSIHYDVYIYLYIYLQQLETRDIWDKSIPCEVKIVTETGDPWRPHLATPGVCIHDVIQTGGVHYLRCGWFIFQKWGKSHDNPWQSMTNHNFTIFHSLETWWGFRMGQFACHVWEAFSLPSFPPEPGPRLQQS